MPTTKIQIWPDVRRRASESETDWCLRILLQDLQSLASDADTLVRAYPPMLPVADETVADLDNHLELAKRAVGNGLITREMWEKARAVDAKVAEMSERHDASLWTNEGLRTRSEWEEVRRLAQEALAAMGYGLDPPPPWQSRFRVRPIRSEGEERS